MTKSTKFITYAAVIAALYTALTLIPGINQLSYGMIQFRVSEALMLLCMFSPAGVVGCTLGCLLANIFSPFGANFFDLVFGTGATLLAALTTYFAGVFFIKHKLLAPIPTVVFNAVIVGSYLPVLLTEGEPVSTVMCIMFVAIGELVVCYVLGVPLAVMAEKRNLFGKR